MAGHPRPPIRGRHQWLHLHQPDEGKRPADDRRCRVSRTHDLVAPAAHPLSPVWPPPQLDVLSNLPEIQLGVAYKDESGRVLPGMPANVEDLEKVTVEYETVPGWQTDISKCRKWSDLPVQARQVPQQQGRVRGLTPEVVLGGESVRFPWLQYVERIEELVQVPITWIGVGPGRKDMVVRS